MRLHRLEIEGFGPFLERQSIDFDALASGGIFLIAGRTGAGKSSVLDAVCFALYGAVPRYEGTDRRLRSDHCAPTHLTEVALEFTSAGERWRVTRSPDYERQKARGTGLTTVAAKALLERWNGAAWIGVASGAREVGEELHGVLGLSQQQFLQVILLAQNRFSQFLLAKNEDRQRLLRTLFGTKVFEDYAQRLDDQRRQSEQALTREADRLEQLLDEADALAQRVGVADDADLEPERTVAERAARVERAEQRLRYRTQTLGDQRERAAQAQVGAEADHARRSESSRAQGERRDVRAALSALESAEPRISEHRRALADARLAETLRIPIEAVEVADHAVRTADAVQAAAAEAYARAGGDAEASATALDEDVRLLTAALARAADARDRETQMTAALARRSAVVSDLETAAAATAAVAAQRTRDAERLGVLASQRDEFVALAADADRASQHLDRMTVRLSAAREAHELDARTSAAERHRAETAVEAARAAAAVSELVRRRLEGYAGELAAALEPGEACAVCGSLDHPAPAVSSGDPVSDEELEQAEIARDAAVSADRSAAEKLADLRSRWEAQVSIADGSVDALAEECERAQALVRECAQAREALGALDADRDALLDAVQRADQRIHDDQAGAAALRQEIAVLDAKIVDTRQQVDAARGTFASVSAMIADAEARQATAEQLRAARAEARARRRARQEAIATRDAELAASSFDDVDEVRRSLLDPAAADALEQRVRTHEAELAAARERLLALELVLADVGEEPVDLAASQATVAASRAHLAEIIAAETAAATELRRLTELRAAIDALVAETAEADARHRSLTRLANTLAGRAPNTKRMTLETFVLAAELEEIVAAANVRLAEMSGGRYRLQHTDALARRNAASGLGIEVHDVYTGRARPPQSLSGGETFLASLALALGLAEVVTARAGGVALDTLFIDEGFGSLDAETLDLAMRTLDDLRAGGRVVGVISHVETMKEQLPAGLTVEATAQGPSVIRQHVTTPH
ncbi:SMC family ATPase [Microbacterium sediminicola]|uniref:Nuclease SbcCD subunit C n=1 Tax=Microbacterium sediminicola TaxID=415210 RepID=A0ABN2I877_9MICO